MSADATAAPAPIAASAGKKAAIAILFLGFLGAIQSADPNINSTALLKASTALGMGTTAALAASISTLILAATAITTGMMGHRLGGRRILVAALILSAVGDLMVAAAPETAFYLLGRALAGVGLGAVYGVGFAFVKDFATGKGGIGAALGTYMAAAGFGALIIVFLGSSLVGVDWRVAFLVVPVLSLISIPLCFALLPGGKGQAAPSGEKRPWDFGGQLLLAFAIIFFLVGVSHAAESLTAPITLGGVALGVVLFAVFLLVERNKGEDGFFPVRLFRDPIFIAAILCGLVYNLTYGATLISFTNLFQYANDLSGIKLSSSQLPFLIAGIAGAILTGKLRGAGKLSRRGALLAGTVICSAGFVLFAVTASSEPSTIWPYLPALILTGLGITTSSIPYGGLIIEKADPRHYGAVSSSRLTIGQFWFALGLAGSTVVIDGITRSRIKEKFGTGGETAVEKFSVSGQKPTEPGLLQEATVAYGDAFAVMMIVLAVVTLIAGIAAYLIIRKFGHGEEQDTLPPAPPSSGVTPEHAKAEHLEAEAGTSAAPPARPSTATS